MVYDFVRQGRGSTLNGQEQGFGNPRLSAGQMRSRPQHNLAAVPIFCGAAFAERDAMCINLLPTRNRADRVSKFLRRLPRTVHFAFISLNNS